MIDSIGNAKDNFAKFSHRFEDSKRDTISMDTFYKLLMAEMANQDPLEPMSNTEFISQMASFTSLQTQQDALYYNNANYAQSLVGKTVTVAAMSGGSLESDNGVVTSMSLQDGKFRIKVNGKDYDLSNIMEVLPSSDPFAVDGKDGTFGSSLIGKMVTVEHFNSEGTKVTETGVVSHIEIKDTDVRLIIDNLAYPISSVVKVENAPPGALEPDIDEDEEIPADMSLVSYAASLIGKKVTVSDTELSHVTYSGIVDSVVVSEGQVYIMVQGDRYPLSVIRFIESVTTENNTTAPAPTETPPPPPTDDTPPPPPTDDTPPGTGDAQTTDLSDEMDELNKLFGLE